MTNKNFKKYKISKIKNINLKLCDSLNTKEQGPSLWFTVFKILVLPFSKTQLTLA